MKKSVIAVALIFASLSVIPCYAHHMAVIVSKGNNLEAVTSADLSKLLKAETKAWPNGQKIMIVLHRDSASQMETLERLNKMSADELQLFFDTHKNCVLLADTDAEILKLVETIPGAIGMVDVRSINDRVKVIKVDNKLPLQAGYLPHH